MHLRDNKKRQEMFYELSQNKLDSLFLMPVKVEE